MWALALVYVLKAIGGGGAVSGLALVIMLVVLLIGVVLNDHGFGSSRSSRRDPVRSMPHSRPSRRNTPRKRPVRPVLPVGDYSDDEKLRLRSEAQTAVREARSVIFSRLHAWQDRAYRR